MKKKNFNEKFNKNIFVFVFLIIVILFIIVFSAINFYDNYKRSVIEDEYNILQQQIILDDIYNSYLQVTDSNKCDILNNQLESYLIINDQLYKRLKSINQNAIVETDDRTKLLFVLTNIKLWFHYKTIDKECNLEDKNVALYFYPEFESFSVEKAKYDAKTVVFVEKLRRLSDNCNIHSIALPYVDYIPILNQMILDYGVKDAPAIYLNGNVYYDFDYNDEDFLTEIGCR